MSRTYKSFMVRYWRLGTGERRIVIEHMQTGDQGRLTTLEAALAWLCDRAETPAAEGVPDSEHHPPQPKAATRDEG